jgi:hypothetical protein
MSFLNHEGTKGTKESGGYLSSCASWLRGFVVKQGRRKVIFEPRRHEEHKGKQGIGCLRVLRGFVVK